jgi:peptidoglycan/LPS O-acetylase OafA/YrhL
MKIDYRPEIDGLRAIAVLAVVLYHADIEINGKALMPGGYLGVDIFLVISGYLITSLILKELELTNTFSLKNFYDRRARRILPALLSVILLCFIPAWMTLLPNDFVSYSESVLSALGFSANIYFHLTQQVYGATDAELVPFLHTWSLAVEEQYYLLFPIFLTVLFRYQRQYLFPVLIVFGMLSLGYSHFQSTYNASFSFYMLPTRIWELLAGGLLAYSEVNHKKFDLPLSKLYPLTGLAIILFCLFSFNEATLHPSIYTVVPIIGTVLIIYYPNKNDLVIKYLSSQILVSIGLISYSLYLFHYPIFSFARISFSDEITNNEKLLLILLAVIASAISYLLVEKPFRNRSLISAKAMWIILVVFMLVAGFTHYQVIEERGYKSRIGVSLDSFYKGVPFLRWDKQGNFLTDKVLFDEQIDGGIKCHVNAVGPPIDREKLCKFNSQHSQALIVLGDSTIAPLTESLAKATKRNDLEYIQISRGGYPFVSFLNRFSVRSGQVVEQIYGRDDYDIAKDVIRENEASILVFMSRSWEYFGHAISENASEYQIDESFVDESVSKKALLFRLFEENVTSLLEAEHHVILIYPAPSHGMEEVKQVLLKIPKDVTIKERKEFLKRNRVKKPLSRHLKETELTYQLYDSLGSHPRLHRVYLDKVFCDLQFCYANDENNIFLNDPSHASFYGAELIAKEIEAVLVRIRND